MDRGHEERERESAEVVFFGQPSLLFNPQILQLHTAWRLMVRVKTVQIKLARQAARKAD